MAYELAHGVVSLTVSTRGVGKEIVDQFDGAQRQADKAGQGIGSRLSSGMTKTLKRGAIAGGAVAGAALGTALYKGMGRLDGIEQAEAKLEGLGHSAQGTAQIMDDALVSVKGTAFGLDEAATVAAAAVAANIEPGQELERVLSLTGDAATIAGTSMADMGDIFNKVATSNKADAQIFNQLNSVGIPITQMLAESMGKTTDEILSMRQAGEINFEMFADAMEQGLGGAALRSGDTFRGALANMGAAAGRFGAEVLRPLHEQGKSAFGGLTDLIDDATERVKPLAAAFGDWLADAGPKFAEFASSAGAAFREFAQSEAVRSSVERLGGVFLSLVDTTKELGPSLADIATSIAEASSAIGFSAWQVFLSLLESAAKILDATLVPAMRGLADFMKSNQGVVTGFAAAFLAFKTIPRLITPISDAFKNFGEQMRYQMTLANGAGQSLDEVIGLGGTATDRVSKFGVAAGLAGDKAKAGFKGFVSMLGGPLMIGLGAATFALGKWLQDSQATKQRMEENAEAAKDLGDELAGAGDGFSHAAVSAAEATIEMVELTNSGRTLAETLTDLGISANTLAQGLAGSPEALAEVRGELEEMAGRGFDPLASLPERLQAMDASRAIGEVNRLDAEIQEAQRRWDSELNEIIFVLRAEGFEGTDAEVRNVAEAMMALKDESATAASKVSAVESALNRLISDNLTVQDALQSWGQYTRDLADSTAEWAEEQYDLNDVLDNTTVIGDDVYQSAKDLTGELNGMTAALVEQGQPIGEVTGKLSEMRNAWLDQMEPMFESRQKAEEYLDTIYSMPDMVATVIEMSGADLAKEQIGGIEVAIGDVQDGAIITPTVITDDVRAGIEEAGFIVEDLKDGTFKLTADTDDAREKLDSVSDKAYEVTRPKKIVVDADVAKTRDELIEIVELSQDENKDVIIDSNAEDQIALMTALGIEIKDTPDGNYKITDNIPDVLSRLETLKKPTSSIHTVTVRQLAENMTPFAMSGLGSFADGGFLPNQATIARGRGAGLVQWAEGETGGEAFIPLAPSKRARSLSILEEVAHRFGVGLTSYADGGIRAAISAARSAEGKTYLWGGTGPEGWDCSGFVGWLQQIVMGLSAAEAAGKRLYTTHSLLGGTTAGLVRGDDPNSPFRVGVNDGHMAGTLAGHNVESGGASQPSSSGIGPGRAGADHPQFTARFHLPASLVAGGDGDSIDSYGLDEPLWSEDDDRKLESARASLQEAMEARDRAYAENRSELDREAADLRVQRAELDVRELEQKREGGGGASSMLVSAAPAIGGAMDDDAIRLRQAEIAVLDAQLSRDQTYSDPSSTTLDKEKADLAVYSAQNALLQAQEDAAAGADTGSTGGLKGIAQKFAADAVGIAYDSLWQILGGSEPRWLGIDFPQPKKPGRPAEQPTVADALADTPSHFSDEEIAGQLPVARGDMGEWLRRHGIPLHDEGGWLEPGLTLNLTRKPEPVLNPEQLEALYRVADFGMAAAGAPGAARAGMSVVHNTHVTVADQRAAIRDQTKRERLSVMMHKGAKP